jgi:hypothetical protein
MYFGYYMSYYNKFKYKIFKNTQNIIGYTTLSLSVYIQTSNVVLDPMRTASLYEKLYSVTLNTHENKGNTFVRNVGNYSSIEAESQIRKLESSTIQFFSS